MGFDHSQRGVWFHLDNEVSPIEILVLADQLASRHLILDTVIRPV